MRRARSIRVRLSLVFLFLFLLVIVLGVEALGSLSYVNDAAVCQAVAAQVDRASAGRAPQVGDYRRERPAPPGGRLH